MYLLNITRQRFQIVCNMYRCEYEIIDVSLKYHYPRVKIVCNMYRYEYEIINMYYLNITKQGLRLYATCTDVNMK